jgi:hypothetical protein
MASLDQIKNMTWHLRCAMSERRALLGRLLKLDEDIAHVQYELDEAWASQFVQPASGDEYDEEECSLRKRKTKKIGKGVCTLKTCKHKPSLDYRDKKRAKEARACKRTKRSHTQLKGERDYGVNVAREMESEIGFREAREAREAREDREEQQHDQSESEHSDDFCFREACEDREESESEHSDDIRSFCDNCTRGRCICDEIEESAGFTRGRHGKYVCKECHKIPLRCRCDEIEESAGFTRGRHGKYVCKETDSAWMERMNSEVLRLTALW